jgi:hypothetical protein
LKQLEDARAVGNGASHHDATFLANNLERSISRGIDAAGEEQD